MPKLIPAILEKNFDGFKDKIKLLRTTRLDIFHLDVMDGLAVPNSCWGDAKAVKVFELNFTVHLMIENPLSEARKWLPLKNVVRVIVRSEEIDNLSEYSALADKNSKLGIAIDPGTNLDEKLLKAGRHNYILVMGVKSGFSGQEFNPVALERIRMVKKIWPMALIGVDGGMNEKTIPLVKQLDVDVINAASFFWNGGDLDNKINFVESE